MTDLSTYTLTDVADHSSGSMDVTLIWVQRADEDALADTAPTIVEPRCLRDR